LLALEPDLDVIGTADDYDSLVQGAEAAEPQVLVTDIRMPPTFQQEGIDAAKALRKAHPGTGVVVLSQYDDPDYAIALLSDGAAGYAYLLKDRVGEGNQLARAVREVATGGSVLDPKIVEALVQPVTDDAGLTEADERLLHEIAEGRPIKAIANAHGTTAAAVADAVEDLFLKLSEGASTGTKGALKRLRMLHDAIVDREEQGEKLSRLLPGGLADKVRTEGRAIGETEELEVTVLMGDIRGYSGIAERSDPTQLASQLSEHRAEMNRAILEEGGTVMQFVGDAVMACFGAPVPLPEHADRAVAAAQAMLTRQRALNERWLAASRVPFGIGIGVSSGPVAAALLGSEERVEYTLVGDTVNLAQRLQDLARPSGRIVLNESTYAALQVTPDAVPLAETMVKGRNTPVRAYRIDVFDHMERGLAND
jgi:class 3 adenylate cyclase/DNA-binding NarL/FixJ family response regulator